MLLLLFFCFSTLCLEVGNRLGFWGGFSCFVSLIWCQLFACLIRAAIFRLPPAFVVCSFFLCHRRLWSVLSFFATGICVQSLSFMAFSAVVIHVRLFFLCLVSTCFRVSAYLSFWYYAVHLLLISFILGDWTGIVSKSVTLWTALQLPLWSKPHLVFRHKVYKIALGSLHKWTWLRRSIKVSSFKLYKFDPFLISQQVSSTGTHA